MAGELFTKKTIAWLAGLGTVAFIVMLLVYLFFGNVRFLGSSGADSFSPSAIGHKAFVVALKRAGYTVLQSQNQTVEKALYGTPLLVIEPGVEEERLPELGRMLSSANVLLVLPKWNGAPNPTNRGHVSQVFRVGNERIETILDLIPGARFTNDQNAIFTTKARPGGWRGTQIPVRPNINDPQLLSWERLTPIVSNPDGVLLGRINDLPGNLYVLTDPDVLQTHGLQDVENAIFVQMLVEMVMADDQTLIIDETSHGFFQAPSLIKRAFSPPFLFPMILLLLAVGVLILATTLAFNSPKRELVTFSKNKMPLIKNISSLLQFGGYYSQVTEAYYSEVLKDVAVRLYAPAGLHDKELMKWVDDIGERRNTSTSYQDIYKRALAGMTRESKDRTRQTKLASDIFKWRNEVLHGTGKDKETE